MALVEMKNQFSGLPMDQLIGGPLTAACDSQLRLAKSTADFIEQIGFYEESGVRKTRTADFSFTKHVITGKDELGNDIHDKEDISLSVPMLAIVNIPSLMIDEVDITFDMEVKSSESSNESSDSAGSFSGSASVGFGPFSASVSISGSVSSHSENTRSSDNSAKYHVSVHATQAGTPEGLSRVLDIIAASVAPQAVEGPQARKDKKIAAKLKPLSEKKKKLGSELSRMLLDLEQKNRELELMEKEDNKAQEAASEDISSLKSEIPGMIEGGGPVSGNNDATGNNKTIDNTKGGSNDKSI